MLMAVSRFRRTDSIPVRSPGSVWAAQFDGRDRWPWAPDPRQSMKSWLRHSSVRLSYMGVSDTARTFRAGSQTRPTPSGGPSPPTPSREEPGRTAAHRLTWANELSH